jgi:endonuclease/exonuclease/phosphatase (EEP) superfamily protein YafD
MSRRGEEQPLSIGARAPAPGMAHVIVAAAAWLNAVAGVLVLIGVGWVLLDALADLAPLWLPASAALLGVAALVGAPRATLAGALLGALAPACLMTPELIAAARPIAPAAIDAPQLTLLTINLWSANQRIDDVDRLIRTTNPDIIVAQEAWAPWKQYLEGLTPDYQVQAGCRYDSDCNVVILSRLRFVETLATLDNGMAAIRLELPARLGPGSVDVLGVHLTRPTSATARRTQLAQIEAVSQALGPSVLVAGDFNATPWLRLRELDAALPATRRTRAMFTWPAPARAFGPLRVRAPAAVAPIDHVYASGDWRAVDVRRGQDVGSDHYPVIARLARERPPEARAPLTP